MKPIRAEVITPQTIAIDDTIVNPLEVRYGWNAFKDIYLFNPDGTPAHFIQPVNSPYHREIKKNQLIPFETFTKPERVSDTGKSDRPNEGDPYINLNTQVTAHDAATALIPTYGRQGYTIFKSLQGVEQSDALRIFQVILPLDYSLKETRQELDRYAEERIESTLPLDYSNLVGETYIVEPLRTESERVIARRLLAEMQAGADTAFTYATTILDKTETDMTTALAGGGGKTTPDPRDKYLSEQLGRELPKVVSSNKSETDEKLNYLIGREQNREQNERIAQLEQELAEMKAATITELPPIAVRETVIADGKIGTVDSKPGGRYRIKFEDETFGIFTRADLTQ